MALSAIFVVLICLVIIALGVGIFVGLIMKAAKGKSPCDDCKRCNEEFCSQRHEEYQPKKK